MSSGWVSRESTRFGPLARCSTLRWRIEYTNTPYLKRSRKKKLENQIANSIRRIEEILLDKSCEGFILGDFYVEVMNVERLEEPLIAVDDLKKDEWVACIELDNHPCVTCCEAKTLLGELGVDENNRYLLNLKNDQSVSEFLEKLDVILSTEKAVSQRAVTAANKAFLETLLEKGIVKTSDGLLDAYRRIHEHMGV